MRFNQFDNCALGSNYDGQGTANSVEGTHRAALRILLAQCARRISLRLGMWRALAMKRMAGVTPGVTAPVAAATCPCNSASRRQRGQRWIPGVVVDPGTVGVR